MMKYPSVTLCTRKKELPSILHEAAKLEKQHKPINFDQLVSSLKYEQFSIWITSFIFLLNDTNFFSYDKKDFLVSFDHRTMEEMMDFGSRLDENDFWKQTLPHIQLSGLCHTYTPRNESMTGSYFGIR